MLVLGIEVSDDLLDRWLGWFAPQEQPFLIPPDLAAALNLEDDRNRLTPEVRDTFCLYGLDRGALVWLSETEARRLPASVRRSQSAPRHWPSSIRGREVEAVVKYVEKGRRPSRHGDVPAATWDAVSSTIPKARRLAGTFPGRSGPNCFGTVMAACGVDGAEDAWMLREPFEDWLAERTAKGGHDDEAGTVLVWRSAGGGAVQHAAITLGDGWALHKPSQGWMSPTKVLTIRDLKYSARAKGQRLHRHHLR
ncbi:hypothetical protein AB0I81_01210 [Nonomuraea sp. NPDC050404]|uniref:hypothetical protein n=1 Tax=Nonomuraea sp. NPDC050404 TaxID=3155783 RepID=UPI0033D71B15